MTSMQMVYVSAGGAKRIRNGQLTQAIYAKEESETFCHPVILTAVIVETPTYRCYEPWAETQATVTITSGDDSFDFYEGDWAVTRRFPGQDEEVLATFEAKHPNAEEAAELECAMLRDDEYNSVDDDDNYNEED